MDQKPVIQYVGQFYIHGSEARQLEVKAPEKRQTPKKAVLPMPTPGKERRI